MKPNDKLQRKINRLEKYIAEVDTQDKENKNDSDSNSADTKFVERKKIGDSRTNSSSSSVNMTKEGSKKEERREKNSGKLSMQDRNWNRLYLHQREGMEWLRKLHREGKGGILADDMGLGKTVQIVVFLSELMASDSIKTVMIAMPVSVLLTWQREFEIWSPELRVVTFHDQSKKERDRILAKVQRRGGIMLTTYGIIASNWEDLSSDFTWDYLILDEGHKIKNSSSKTAKAVRALRVDHRLILTGTAVQNNLQELWALFDFVQHGTLLGSRRTFKLDYSDPIERARQKDASGSEQRHGQSMAESLRRMIQPYFLRRTKHQVTCTVPSPPTDSEDGSVKVLQMPSLTRKNDLIVWVYLSDVQEIIYREFLQLDTVKNLLLRSEKRSPLVELNILKKLCDHPRLLSATQCADLGMEGAVVSENGNATTHLPEELLLQESGKLMLLVKLVNHLRDDGHRCLIFSQSRKMLDVIQRILRHYGEHEIVRLDGTVTKLSERQRLIEQFSRHKRYSVFLLTTQVGGVGLTLTAADRVIIFDPSWNPATDAQAVDRVYRIGQEKNVVVYRLITCGTVEEKIYRRQIFKDSITRQATGIQVTDNNPYRYFSGQDLHELFALANPRHSSTQVQLAELHRNQRRTDETLDFHLAFLHSLEIFGISDHDLMFSKEESASTQVHEQESIKAQNLRQQAEVRIAKESKDNENEKELRYEMSRLDLTGRPLMNSTTISQQQPQWHPPNKPRAEIFQPKVEDSKRPMFNRNLTQQPLSFNFNRNPESSTTNPPPTFATQGLLGPILKPTTEPPLFKPTPRTVESIEISSESDEDSDSDDVEEVEDSFVEEPSRNVISESDVESEESGVENSKQIAQPENDSLVVEESDLSHIADIETSSSDNSDSDSVAYSKHIDDVVRDQSTNLELPGDLNISSKQQLDEEDIIEMDLTQEVDDAKLMEVMANKSFHDILHKSLYEKSTVIIDDSFNVSMSNKSTLLIEDSFASSPLPRVSGHGPALNSTPHHNNMESPMVIGQTPILDGSPMVSVSFDDNEEL